MNMFISIIIPVYNTEEYIAQCLDSILSQTLTGIEILCIDDGSTDGSADIIQQFQDKDSRVQLISMTENSGAGPCRNEGMAQAKGEFIAFVDSDDLLASRDCLEKLYNTARKNNVKIAGGNLVVFDKDNIDNAKDWGKVTFTEDRLYTYAKYPNSHGYYRFIYNRQFIVENDYFFPPLRRYQDPVWFASVMVKAGQFYGMNIPVYAYRKSHQTIRYTAEKTKHVLDGMIININLFNKERLINHCNNEKKEIYNFIYRSIYGGVFQGREFFKILKVIQNNYRSSDEISFGLRDIKGFIKMGLIIFKNKIKRLF